MNLRWVGNVNSQWDLVGDANWQSTGPQQFFNLDNVTFDDTSTNTNDVELVGQLQPGSITVNATRNYRLAGAGAITGGTGLTKSGTGTLTVATNNSYRGATAVNAGTLILSGNNANTGAITVAAGATLQVGAGGPSGSLGSGAITNDGILIFNRSDASLASNVISGGGELRHTGTGTLTLGTANTYTGATTITAGTLRVTDETSLGDLTGGAVAISSGGALDLSGSATANGIDFGIKQFLIAGAGVGGTGSLTNSGAVAHQNAFEQVVLTGDAAVGGTGRLDIRADTSTLDLAGFTLTKVGSGQFTLVGTTVSHGNIVVNGGTFAIETTSSLSSTGSTGTITYNPGSTAQFFSLTGDVTRPMIFNGGNTIGNASAPDSTVASPITLAGDVTFTNLNNSTGALTLTGNITETGGPRSVTKNGPTVLNLNGTTTYSGTTTINGGTVNIPTGATLTTNNAVTTAAGTTLNINGTASLGGISGPGSINVGDGTAVGTLTAGHVRQSGLNIAAGSTTTVRPNGTTAGTSNFGGLSIAGAADAWTSKLDVTNNDSAFQSSAANKATDFARLYNQVKQGFNNGTWTGLGITSSAAAGNTSADTGINVVDNALLGYTDFSGQSVTADSILLKYTYYGDIDQNGQVDADDLTVFASNFGRTQGATQVDGDIDFNGAVNADDLTVFANNFNKGVGNPLASASVQAVPEPATLCLAASAGLLLLLMNRRIRQS
jgi:autotransporter-associated beta strand protein